MRLNCLTWGTVWSRSRVLLGFALLVTIAAASLGGLSLGVRKAGVTRSSEVASALSFAPARSVHDGLSLRSAYGQLPLAFEMNQGQSDPRVKFLARGSGYGLFLAANEAVLALQHPAFTNLHSADRTSVVRMALDGANPNAEVVGTDELPGKSNYFIGNNPAKWHRNVPQFGRVRYHGIYPGIDLVYYGKQGRLEYDFEVAPQANPNQVALRFRDAEKLVLNAQSDLVIGTGGGVVRLEAPRVYQKIGEEQRPVTGRFVLRGENQVGFELGAYDRNRSLIIDPVLAYSTYFGGGGEEACSAILPPPANVPTSGCPAVAVDSAGNIYLAGATTSVNLPLTPPPTPPATGPLPFQPCLDHPGATPPCANDLASSDAFIAKINPSASPQLIFSTYLGGTDSETTAGMAVDAGFDVILAGNTKSSDFPTSGAIAAFQSTPVPPVSPGNNHVFVSKIDATGANLIYSTYLSGHGIDTATGLALDVKSKIYVTGTTTSTDMPTATTAFPATVGAFQTASKAASQFFMSRIDPTLAGFPSLTYSTYIGGSTPGSGTTLGGGIAVDTSSNVYVTGGTDFTDMPVLNAFQAALKGGMDVWVGKFNPTAASGAQELYLTYLGGSADDIGYGIAVDAGFNAYITGSTASTDFPAAGTGVFQKCLDTPPLANPATCPTGLTNRDAFVAKLGNPCTGTSCTGTNGTNVPLNYFTYLGGSGSDVGLAITVDSIQGAQVTGWTDSSGGDATAFPHPNNPVQSTLAGGRDAFISRIDTTATSSTALGHFGTYLGGSLDDAGTSIALDAQNFTYVGGETFSSNFPLSATPFQGSLDGASDAFVTKLGPTLDFGVTETASPSPAVGIGNAVTFTYKILNNADLTSGILFTDTFTSSFTFGSANASPGQSSCPLVGNSVTCSVATLNGGASATVTVVLTPTVAAQLVGDSGKFTVLGSPKFFTPNPPATVNVSDFSIDVAPATFTVPAPAGTPATYTVTVSPSGPFPSAVTLAESTALPSGATASFPNGASISNLSSGPQSRQLVINTTARVHNPASLWQRLGPVYAAWFPISGLALLGIGIGGAGIGGKGSRKRWALGGMLLGGFLALILFQAGCGTSTSTGTTTGTPAGTYTLTVTATSGSATRTKQIQLVVK